MVCVYMYGLYSVRKIQRWTRSFPVRTGPQFHLLVIEDMNRGIGTSSNILITLAAFDSPVN